MSTQASGDGAALLDEIVTLVRRYVVLPESAAYVCAAWVMHTHAVEAADHTPYLTITSATKRCGKSTLLETLSLLAANSWLTGSTTSAALIRRIAAETPTLLYDEADVNFGGRELSEAFRGILNNGFRRGGSHTMCVPTKDGGYEVEVFEVFCPKAVAGIGQRDDTILDRSFQIVLQRKGPSDSVERFRRASVEALAGPLNERLAAWASANREALKLVVPDLPEALDDRGQDISEPLLAIADLAGGAWPSRLREAVVELRTQDDADKGDILIVLLEDIREEMGDREFIAADDLVKRLIADESSVWREWRRGQSITAAGLARQLKKLRIEPQRHQKGGFRARGYFATQFEEHFRRYLPEEAPSSGWPEGAVEAPVEAQAFIHPRVEVAEAEVDEEEVIAT
jgi:hypothetical protein